MLKIDALFKKVSRKAIKERKSKQKNSFLFLRHFWILEITFRLAAGQVLIYWKKKQVRISI